MLTAACGGDDGEDASVVATTDDVDDDTTAATTSVAAEVASPSVATTTDPAGGSATEGTAAPTGTAEPAADGTASDTTTPAAGDGTASTTWSDPDGLFMIDFPGEPTVSEIPVPDVGDGASVTVFVFEDARGAFLANRTDSTDIDASVTEVSLQDAVAGSLSFVGGTIGRSDEITIQGRDAVRFDFVVTGGVGEGLSIADGLVLYQLLGIGEESSQEAFATFVDSFTFTDGGS